MSQLNVCLHLVLRDRDLVGDKQDLEARAVGEAGRVGFGVPRLGYGECGRGTGWKSTGRPRVVSGHERSRAVPENPRHRRPWSVSDVELELKDRRQGEVRVHVAGTAAQWPCPECGRQCPGYDHLPRRWRHLDTLDQGSYHKEAFSAVLRRHLVATGIRRSDRRSRQRFSESNEVLDGFLVRVHPRKRANLVVLEDTHRFLAQVFRPYCFVSDWLERDGIRSSDLVVRDSVPIEPRLLSELQAYQERLAKSLPR